MSTDYKLQHGDISFSAQPDTVIELTGLWLNEGDEHPDLHSSEGCETLYLYLYYALPSVLCWLGIRESTQLL